MSAEEAGRSFCREAVDKVQQEAAAVGGSGGSGPCAGGAGPEKSGFINPRKYRNPLPFNLKNPYMFTAKFFAISTVGFVAPYLVVLYQMYKTSKST